MVFSRLSDIYKKYLGIVFILFISLGYAQTEKEVFLFSYFTLIMERMVYILHIVKMV